MFNNNMPSLAAPFTWGGVAGVGWEGVAGQASTTCRDDALIRTNFYSAMGYVQPHSCTNILIFLSQNLG